MPIGTTIDGLNAVTSLTANDEVAVWDKEASDEPTKKITGQNLADGVKSLAGAASSNQLADAYSSSATYAVGDLCIHDNTLYKCTTAIGTAEAWNAAHWTATTLDEVMVKYADVVNNLTSTATDKPGSAAMLKKLNDEKQAKIEDAGVVFTPASGITSNLFIRRYGNVVCINGYVTATSNFTTSETTIGTIGANNRPSGVVRIPARTANVAYEVGAPAYVAIGTSGGIGVTASSGTSHKACYFTASYIV